MNLVFCSARAEIVEAAVKTLLPDAMEDAVLFTGPDNSPLRRRYPNRFLSWGNGYFNWSAAMELWSRLEGNAPTRSILPLNNGEGEGYEKLRAFARLVTRGETTEFTPDGGARPLTGGALMLMVRPEERWHAGIITLLELARPLLGFSGKDVPAAMPCAVTECATVREMETAPDISVVIRAFNEKELLEKTLSMVMAQEGVRAETILIDSGSTDGTMEIAKKFPVRIFSIPKNSFSYGAALNLGARLARGKTVVNLSAHAVPADIRWLKELTAPLADARIAAVYGRELPMERRCGHFERKILADSFGETPNESSSNPFFSNANSAVLKKLLIELPFDEQAGWAEDQIWAYGVQKRGMTIRYQPAAAVHHSHNLSMAGNFARCYKYHRAMFGGAWQGKEREVQKAFRARLARRSLSFRRFLCANRLMGTMGAAFYAPYCEFVNYLGCREAANGQ
ncbi:MAG: glycosyltransferase family 2 protein [Nitrospinae bacterium]|nr:glycosyltransferase family 2 protein [Nitrospinota bacterium]